MALMLSSFSMRKSRRRFGNRLLITTATISAAFSRASTAGAQDLGAYLDFGRHVSPLEPGEDGRVIYVLAENDETIAKVLTQVESELSHRRVLVAVPSAPVELTETALEVWCLRRLQHDPEIVGEDPLAATELEQFADDARAHLQRLIERVVWPGQDGSEMVPQR